MMTFQCEVPRGPREGETVRAGPAGDQHLLHCQAGVLPGRREGGPGRGTGGRTNNLPHTGRTHLIVFTTTTPSNSFLDVTNDKDVYCVHTAFNSISLLFPLYAHYFIY